jgi:hypothetical protein
MFPRNANVPSLFPFPRVSPGGAVDLATAHLEDLLDAWNRAAHEAAKALEAWTSSKAGERRDAHVVYRAALDREECAATVLAAATA